jgi:PEGA domain
VPAAARGSGSFGIVAGMRRSPPAAALSQRAVAAWLAAAMGLGAARPAIAAGPPVVVSAAPGADAIAARKVRDVVAARRAIREDLALPPASSVSTERAAMEQRAASIRLSLGRAQRAESEASWDDCVREAAGAMSDALEVLAKVDDLGLLRALHVQIGACMTLAQSEANARPHFIAAALLDEAEVKPGLHREEAERAQIAARAEVLGRSRGRVRIETVPPGAEVWIDGRRAAGLSPLDVDARLGDHFITTRRFRFEPHTERAVLQPSGVVRVALDPAQRGTLRDQLAAVVAGSAPRPGDGEMLLARAVWSRAEQAVVIGGAAGATRVQVLDAQTGQSLGEAAIQRGDDDDVLRKRVCSALGETCEAPSRGVPWYVWPLGGAALVSGAITAGVLASSNRTLRICPASGCH